MSYTLVCSLDTVFDLGTYIGYCSDQGSLRYCLLSHDPLLIMQTWPLTSSFIGMPPPKLWSHVWLCVRYISATCVQSISARSTPGLQAFSRTSKRKDTLRDHVQEQKLPTFRWQGVGFLLADQETTATRRRRHVPATGRTPRLSLMMGGLPRLDLVTTANFGPSSSSCCRLDSGSGLSTPHRPLRLGTHLYLTHI
jgi:hypothetical protein